jgi:hypothetical protein
MSMPAIFFAASEAEATAMELNHDLPPEDVVELGGVDTLKMSMLWAIIDRKIWDVKLMDAFRSVRSTESEWTDAIPDDLTQKIAGQEGAELERVAEQWSATQEMGCSPAEARDLLQEIAGVARRSIDTHRELFLYTCL